MKTITALLDCRSPEFNSGHSSWRMLQPKRAPVISHLFDYHDVSRYLNKSVLRHEYSQNSS
jgi:hypothetical protein